MQNILCERCQERPATTTYTQSLNGKTTQVHLCSECAKELGLGGSFGQLLSAFPFSDLLGNIFMQPLTSAQRQSRKLPEQSCPKCHTTIQEIAQSGRLGCPECYRFFADCLSETIEKIHGQTKHTGKIPHSAEEQTKLRREIERLRETQQKAVSEEDFETAARLRDQIKELEGQVNENDA